MGGSLRVLHHLRPIGVAMAGRGQRIITKLKTKDFEKLRDD